MDSRKSFRKDAGMSPPAKSTSVNVVHGHAVSPMRKSVADQGLSVCVVAGEGRLALGGLATYQRHLASGLRDCGTSVTCVSRFDRDISEPLDYHGGATGIGRPVDGIPTALVGPAAWARPLLPRLRHLTGRPVLRRFAAQFFEAAYTRSFAAAVPASVDVIHYIGTGWELLGFAALREARRRGVQFTVWPAVHAGTWGDSPLDVDLYSQAEAVFCQSDHEADHLAAIGVPRDRLVRAWLAPSVPMTGDGERFRATYCLGDRPLVLFIARKVRSKGFHALCHAMAQVTKQVPGACLVALGPDGEPPYPLVPAGAYVDLGTADDATKADALAACDVFCLPSSAESFGIVYVEAWAYGKPVIGGPAKAAVELIQFGRGGSCVSGNTSQLTLQIIALLLDKVGSRGLGDCGQRMVRDRFNWPEVIRLHQKVFQHVINSCG